MSISYSVAVKPSRSAGWLSDSDVWSSLSCKDKAADVEMKYVCGAFGSAALDSLLLTTQVGVWGRYRGTAQTHDSGGSSHQCRLLAQKHAVTRLEEDSDLSLSPVSHPSVTTLYHARVTWLGEDGICPSSQFPLSVYQKCSANRQKGDGCDFSQPASHYSLVSDRQLVVGN